MAVPNVIRHWQRCRANKGKHGVDGQMFADIEKYGVEKFLGELAEELRTKRYEPQPVRRAYIAKPDGKRPTIRDRVVQTALLIILEPIFEADLQEEQYAYRENRSVGCDAASASTPAGRSTRGGGCGKSGAI